ncbi:MAG: PAS domain S-box protein [Candidatus Bathyarchaeota archaeon]|nr:PAS domain S-box protein [Candidatus Bathyarchaeota archaeon]
MKQVADAFKAKGELKASTADSVQKALERLKQQIYDVVIASSLLPQGSGLKLLKLMRKNADNTPFILVASDENDEAEVEALNLGAERYISLKGRQQAGSLEVRQALSEVIKKKKISASLKLSEEKFHALIDSTKDGIAIIDEEGKLVHWNNACEEIFSYKKEEVQGRSIRFLMPPDQLRDFNQAVKRIFTEVNDKVFGSKTMDTMQISGIRKDGSLVQTEMSISFFAQGPKKCGLIIIRDITKCRRTENALKKERDMLEAITENVGGGLVIVNKEYKVLFANSFIKRYMGKVEGKLCYTVLNTLDVPCPDCGVSKIFAGKKTIDTHEYCATGSNGEPYWIQIVATPIKDEKGNVISAVEIAVDITERKKAENEAILEKERSKAILDSSPDAITFVDIEGKIVDCNEAALKLFRYSRDEFSSKSVMDLVDEGDRQRILLLADQVFKKGIVRNQEIPVLKKDGEKFTAECSGSLVRDRNNKPVGFVILSRDITERKKAEIALKNSEEQFRSLAENSPNMIFINQRGKLVFVNNEAAEAMGYSKEEFYSPDFNFFDLIAPESKDMVKAKFKKHLAVEEINPYECKLVTKKGQTKDVIINSRIIKYNDETALLGIATDITERKKADLEIAHAKEKFRVYVENSPVAVFVASPDGKYEYVNEAASKLLSYSREELLMMSIPQLIFKEDLQTALEKFIEVKETGRSLSEVTLKTKDGLPVYVILNSVKLPDGKLLAFCENVTERKNAEREILLQTERLKATFAASPDAILSIDMKGKIVGCNEEALRLFRYPSKESLLSTYPIELVVETERKKAVTDLKAVFESDKKIRNKEFIGLKNDGKEFTIEVSESTIKDHSGQRVGVIATIRDITERKKAEKQIRLLSSVVQQTVEGIAVSDLQGKLLFVNSAWLKMHDFNEDEEKELIGQWVMKFYCNLQFDAIDYNLQPNKEFRGRITQVRKDGTTFAALASLSPLRNEKGQIIGVIHTAKPLTEIVRDIRDVKSANACTIKNQNPRD